jgi:hypothetical protein
LKVALPTITPLLIVGGKKQILVINSEFPLGYYNKLCFMAAVDIVSLITSFIENYHSWVTLVIHENNKITK